MKLEAKQFNELVYNIKQDKGWFEPFIELVKVYYDSNITGGSLHIVLDDGNLGKYHVVWCAGYAAGKEDNEGSDIANLLLFMTMKQKKLVYEQIHRRF